MATKVFQIFVSDAGKFTYKPEGDWNYADGDELVFTCAEGPFSVTYVPVDEKSGLPAPMPPPPPSPFGGSAALYVESGAAKEGDVFRTSAQDIKTPNERTPAEQQAIDAIVAKNKAQYGKEFVMKFRYDIRIPPAESGLPARFQDATKNGLWIC